MTTGPGDRKDGPQSSDEWLNADSSDELNPVIKFTPPDGQEVDENAPDVPSGVRADVSELLSQPSEQVPVVYRPYPFAETREKNKEVVLEALNDPSRHNRYVTNLGIGSFLDDSLSLGELRALQYVYPVDARALFDASAFLTRMWAGGNVSFAPQVQIRDVFNNLSLDYFLSEDPKYGKLVRLLRLPPKEVGGRFPLLSEMRRLTFWNREPITNENVAFFVNALLHSIQETTSISELINNLYNCAFGNLGSDFNLPLEDFFPDENNGMAIPPVLANFLSLLESCVERLEINRDGHKVGTSKYESYEKQREFLAYFSHFMRSLRQKKWMESTVGGQSPFAIVKQVASELPRDHLEESIAIENNDQYWLYFLNNMSVKVENIIQNIEERLDGWMKLQRTLRNGFLMDYLASRGYAHEVQQLSDDEDSSSIPKAFLWAQSGRLTLLVDTFNGKVDAISYKDLPNRNRK